MLLDEQERLDLKYNHPIWYNVFYTLLLTSFFMFIIISTFILVSMFIILILVLSNTVGNIGVFFGVIAFVSLVVALLVNLTDN